MIAISPTAGGSASQTATSTATSDSIFIIDLNNSGYTRAGQAPPEPDAIVLSGKEEEPTPEEFRLWREAELEWVHWLGALLSDLLITETRRVVGRTRDNLDIVGTHKRKGRVVPVKL
jgi:hypothetical protein